MKKEKYYIEKRIHNESYEIEAGSLISNFITIKDSEGQRSDIQRIKLIAESYGSRGKRRRVDIYK